MTNTNRLQVDIFGHQLEELKELLRLGGLRTKRELWDTAFTLLKWATKKKAQGLSVGSMSDDGSFMELEMPFLEHYAQSVKRGLSSNGKARTGRPAAKPLPKTRKPGSIPLSIARKRHTA